MRITFTRDKVTGRLITADNKELPPGFVSGFPHGFSPDGSGWVEVPSSIGDITLKLVGVRNDSDLPKDSEPRIITPEHDKYLDQKFQEGELSVDMKALRGDDGYDAFIKQNVDIMLALGFVQREEARWYHPVLGEDQQQNWMWLDLDTDDVKTIVTKLFRSGWVKGQKQIRYDIRKALDM